jgi:hypothetical protein
MAQAVADAAVEFPVVLQQDPTGGSAMSDQNLTTDGPRFSLGQMLATPGVLEVLEQSGQSPADFLDRHARGDWGDVDQGDWQLNDHALQDGSRILSAYKTAKGAKIWVITEAAGDDGKRAATTLLLPEEY